MKLYKATTSILFAGLLIGCSQQKDMMGKSLNSYLAVNPGEETQCKVTNSSASVEATPASLFETTGKKVLIEENNFGENSKFASAPKNAVLVEGKELVVVVDEACVNQGRSTLTAELETSARHPASQKSFVVSLDQDTTLSELESLAENDECVKGIGENVVHTTLATPNDPQFSQQEHFTNIKASQGWEVFFNSTSGIQRDIIVAVIDSGVDQDHPDLVNNRWVNAGEVAGNNQDDDNNGYVDDVYGYNFASDIANPNPQTWPSPNAGGETHGTHVAGLAAASSNNSIGVAGVNGLKSKIMSLNVFGATAGASTANIDNAIRYAADNGAHVINMSLGGQGSSTSTDQAIKYAIGKGVVVMIAAGNSNADTSGFTPARYGMTNPGALAVGAIDSVSSAKCSFSNFSASYVEMAAPGCKSGTQGVLATLNGGGYGRLQGTSMASPVAAGVASLAYGLIWARTNQKPTPALVEEVLKAGARVESRLTGSFKDGKVVDLVSLSTEINRRYPAGVTPAPTPTPGGSNCP